MNSFCLKTKGFWALVLFLSSARTTSAASDSDRLSFCQIWESDIEHSEGSLNISRNYEGLWISEKCETRQGPLYLLRQYRFHKNGHFRLVQFRYKDPFCTSASYAVVASGALVPSPEKATTSLFSWVVQGGLELDYVLHKVLVIPYTVADGQRLYHLVNHSCPSYRTSKWRPYRKYRVLSYNEDVYKRKKTHNKRLYLDLEDIDCTQYLDLGFNELQLTRLESRLPVQFVDYRHRQQILTDVKQRYQSQLFLGVEGPDSRRRPTYYQPPLVLSSESTSCPACRSLSKESLTSPPKLHPFPYTQLNLLKGEWISMRCEVRPHGMFVKRRYTFDSFRRLWFGVHSYFKHPSCAKPMFQLRAKGSFLTSSPSADIPSAWEYDFEITEASLTPQDPHFLANLNGIDNCGSRGSSWKLNETADLTQSGGCEALGIIVPTTELNILKFEQDKYGLLLLYLGETYSEHQGRPTSFQAPLIQCSSGLSTRKEDYATLNNRLNPLPLVSGIGKLYIPTIETFCMLLVLYVSVTTSMHSRDS